MFKYDRCRLGRELIACKGFAPTIFVRQSISPVPIPSQAIAGQLLHVFYFDVGHLKFYYLSGVRNLSIPGTLPFDTLVVLVSHVVDSANFILFSYLFMSCWSHKDRMKLIPYDVWILKLPFVKNFNINFVFVINRSYLLKSSMTRTLYVDIVHLTSWACQNRRTLIYRLIKKKS